MEVQPDFNELLGLFNEHKVDFIIVGGYALAFHGAPRFTGDIDLFVRPKPDNANRILAALSDFGFGSLEISISDLTTPDQIIQLGQPPVRIDIMTSISGLTWDEAVSGKIAGQYGENEVFFLGRDQYMVNKRATGRSKDLADIEALGEIPEKDE